MSDKVTVTVNEGKIKGIKKTSIFSGTEYFSFLGVPYGQAPEGQLRFKDPVKVRPWKNIILDATTEKQGCRQFCIFKRELAGSEDCLYNNIHTTKLPSKGDPLKPVIVDIHPGGLIFGSPDPDIYGSPDFLMHHDVVFVTVCFRLHILGFLDLGLKECSGNQALKDIILSLQWIKNNIKAFGGDPDNITLLGSSSGSSLVQCLMLSPKVEGLFHKAVLMGMYVTNPVLIIPQENASIAFELAKSVDYEGTDENERKKLLSYYKQLPVDTIISMRPESVLQKQNSKAPVCPGSLFTHIFNQGENLILPLSPKEMTPSMTRIPLIVGFCDNEAAVGFFPRFKNLIKKNFYSTVRQNPWGWGANLNDEELKQIQKQIETFYLNGKSVDNAPLMTKIDIQTDISLSDVYDSVINVVAADLPNSVYVYKFGFEGNIGTMKDRIREAVDEPLEGTVHGCDYSYFAFMKEYTSRKKPILTQRSKGMVEIFTKLICTFARTGDPNYENLGVQWNPTTVENPCYLSINEQLKSHEGKLNGKRMEFWENMKNQFTKS
ncbi:juvenile hormone esterase-like [Planococcus citri]|uniref:juvenile hormone esterase-like n=1 Tax=Planococcus citri TaxID=170843 RepID=UPI0031F842B5